MPKSKQYVVLLIVLVAMSMFQLHNDEYWSNMSSNFSSFSAWDEPKPQQQHQRQKGLVLSNLLGYLGNSVLEIGFANRMAIELDWQIYYRLAWRSPFFDDPRAEQCFPKAFLEDRLATANHSLLQGSGISTHQSTNEELDKWIDHLKNQTSGDSKSGSLYQKCEHLICNFTNINNLLEPLKEPDSPTQFLHLHAFFIHGGWVEEEYWRNKMSEWFQQANQCCATPAPPENAVVIHIRDFEIDPDNKQDHFTRTVKPSAYRHIMQQYKLLDPSRPVWIVCQPASVNSSMVLGLLELLEPDVKEVVVQTGTDAYDAFCILQRSKTVLVSYGSTFSQAAALSSTYGEDVQVHVPINDVRADTTMHVGGPGWKYHFVNQAKDGISEFDAPKDRFEWGMF